MNLNRKITCTICGTVLIGIFITESGFCHECTEIPAHVPEIFVYGNMDSSLTYFSPTMSSILSDSANYS